MPKIIKDVETKILTAAEELFITQGYQETDMRKIAAHAEIAVGTIYKYYRDKQDLYMQVMARSWSTTMKNIEGISLSEGDPKVLLREMLEQLVQEMSARQPLSSLWTEISALYTSKNPDFVTDNQFIGMHARFAQIIGGVLEKMIEPQQRKETAEIMDRLGSYAFVMAVDCCMLPPEQAIDQSGLIANLLTSYIEKYQSGDLERS
jgi:AcrR family transcriptional regulator